MPRCATNQEASRAEASGKRRLCLLDKQLTPPVRADVAFDELARIRRLEVGAALAALVALGVP